MCKRGQDIADSQIDMSLWRIPIKDIAKFIRLTILQSLVALEVNGIKCFIISTSKDKKFI